MVNIIIHNEEEWELEDFDDPRQERLDKIEWDNMLNNARFSAFKYVDLDENIQNFGKKVLKTLKKST